MTRERKLSKWSLTNALSRSRTVVETARYLNVHRDTVYENAKRFGIDISAVLGGIPSASDTPATPVLPQPNPGAPPLTEQEIAELDAAGWTRHECPGDDCAICREALQKLEARTPPKRHLVNPASFGLAANTRGPELWRSYAPRKRPWEK